MTPSPSREHQWIVGKLYYRLMDHVERNALGKAYIAPLDTIFDPYTTLQPDILFVREERLAEVERERIEGTPDLVVEVLSPSPFHKDLRRKMTVYSHFGVQPETGVGGTGAGSLRGSQGSTTTDQGSTGTTSDKSSGKSSSDPEKSSDPSKSSSDK